MRLGTRGEIGLWWDGGRSDDGGGVMGLGGVHGYAPLASSLPLVGRCVSHR